MKDLKQHIRPLPYYSTYVTNEERWLADNLRREFVPKIARRFKGHHLRGFSNDFITSFIRENKKTHPFFFKTDIAQFFPSIRHLDAIVYAQVAYKELIGLKYVPDEFKRRTKTVLSQPTPPKTVGKSLINGNSDLERFLFVQVELLEKMNDKLTQMLSLQKTQLRVMQEMNSVLR
jgi:hypothetical protein